MKKLLVFLLIITTTPLIAGIYGMLHDQLTYTIAPEYYTKFKFQQFGLTTDHLSERQLVNVVGFMATWWVGIIIGVVLGLFGLACKEWKQMLSLSYRCILLNLAIAFTCGIIGLTYAYATVRTNNYVLRDPVLMDVVEMKDFIAVGYMHNFGYAGGLLGLIAAIVYMRRKKANTV